MTTTTRSPARTANDVRRIGFLLLDDFTLMAMASAIEPLRMANQLSGQTLYDWVTLSPGRRPVSASDSVTITPDLAMEEVTGLDMVIVCGGVDIRSSAQSAHITWLQMMARRGVLLGGVCTGSWVLAHAGLLDGYECSVHWEFLAAMQEAFPRVAMTTRLFSFDRDRCTSSGGTAPMDMMLSLILKAKGASLVAAISEMLICDRVRSEQDHQRVPLKHMLGTQQPKLQEIVALMEANLEEPIELDQLAHYVAVSRRQLERLFQKYLHCSPSRYYLKLRLVRARQLLKQTSMSIIEIASVCGFISTPHFSKCYREYFGIPPREERLGSCSADVVAFTRPTESEAVNGAASAFQRARNESTFASVVM